MFKYIIFLVFATVCHASILLSIHTSSLQNRTRIKFSGNIVKHLTDKDVGLFQITDANLKRGVRVEMGKVPDEVFLRDPTAYGDLFKKYRWPEVKRTVSIKNATIIEFIKKEVVLISQKFINNTTLARNISTEMTETVPMTMTANWFDSGLPNDVMGFNTSINFEFGNALYETPWRNTKTKQFNFEFKRTKGDLVLASNQTVITKLIADRILLLIQVDFQAHLVGNIVANYAKTYGSYHFWSPTINNIMLAGKINNKITTKMVLEVKYYANARIKIIDKNTGNEIRAEIKKPPKIFNFTYLDSTQDVKCNKILAT